MASILKVDEMQGVTSAGDITITGEGTATMRLQQGLAKAWIDYKGTSTNSIRDSLNFASVSDNGTGDYTASYTSAMGNANYSALYSAGVKNVITAQERLSAIATDSYRIEMQEDGGSASDSSYVMIAMHGDLA
jgi:hypothetical protein